MHTGTRTCPSRFADHAPTPRDYVAGGSRFDLLLFPTPHPVRSIVCHDLVLCSGYPPHLHLHCYPLCRALPFIPLFADTVSPSARDEPTPVALEPRLTFYTIYYSVLIYWFYITTLLLLRTRL